MKSCSMFFFLELSIGGSLPRTFGCDDGCTRFRPPWKLKLFFFREVQLKSGQIKLKRLSLYIMRVYA